MANLAKTNEKKNSKETNKKQKCFKNSTAQASEKTESSAIAPKFV